MTKKDDEIKLAKIRKRAHWLLSRSTTKPRLSVLDRAWLIEMLDSQRHKLLRIHGMMLALDAYVNVSPYPKSEVEKIISNILIETSGIK